MKRSGFLTRFSGFLTFCSCLALPALAAAQSPCTVPVTETLNGAKLVAALPDYAATFNGAPVWDSSELGIFPKGADPTVATPTSVTPILKSAWTLVDAASSCYTTASLVALQNVAANTDFDARVRHKQGSTAGAWSAAAPFGRPAPPAAPTGLHATP